MTLQFPEMCKECGGKCCHHQIHMTDGEYERLRKIIGDEECAKGNPIVEERAGWIVFQKTCPCLTETGCKIENPEDRPMVCQLYPFIPLQISNGLWLILLTVPGCPNWALFGAQYEEAQMKFKEWLREEKGVA
jgi:Fe-S-cluster containining protein